MPPEIQDRDADVWEPLIAVADAVGGDWPERAREAAVALVAESKDREPSLGMRLLADVRTAFGDADEMTSKAILAALHAMEEAPWKDIKGKPLDERGLANRLRQYGVKSKVIRIGNATPRGYTRADLYDAWVRYLPPIAAKSATGATSATSVENAYRKCCGCDPGCCGCCATRCGWSPEKRQQYQQCCGCCGCCGPSGERRRRHPLLVALRPLRPAQPDGRAARSL